MPRRWATQTRIWAYRYLELRDGPDCAICGAPGPGLDIDHIDQQPDHNATDNLRLLCRKCNVALANKARSRKRVPIWEKTIGPPLNSGVEAVGAREEGNPTTRIAKEAFAYQDGSAEMRANAFMEPRFREWLLKEVKTRGHISKRQAIAAGAEITGCSLSTAERYLAKLTSSAGPLQETRDMLSQIVIASKSKE